MSEWNATEYARHSSLQQAMAEEQLGRLALEGGERILDVGCGDGKVSAEIARRVPCGTVLGIDPSRDMIAFARNHFGPPAWANLSFEVADARRLPYREQFDLVVSFNALHWVREQGLALGAIRAALKPGARALLRLVPEGRRKSLEDVIEDVRQGTAWSGHFGAFQRPYAHFTPDEYRALAEQQGLRVLGLLVEDRSWNFQTRAAFAAFCRATFVEWTRCLPEDSWMGFITAVLDRYQFVVADGPQDAHTFKYYQMELTLVVA